MERDNYINVFVIFYRLLLFIRYIHTETSSKITINNKT